MNNLTREMFSVTKNPIMFHGDILKELTSLGLTDNIKVRTIVKDLAMERAVLDLHLFNLKDETSSIPIKTRTNRVRLAKNNVMSTWTQLLKFIPKKRLQSIQDTALKTFGTIQFQESEDYIMSKIKQADGAE